MLLRWVLTSHRVPSDGKRAILLHESRGEDAHRRQVRAEWRMHHVGPYGPHRTVRKFGLEVGRRRRWAHGRDRRQTGAGSRRHDELRDRLPPAEHSARPQSPIPRETRVRYAEALAALSSNEQLVCLWHIAGFSNQEIAAQLGMTADHVITTLRQAASLLRTRARREP